MIVVEHVAGYHACLVGDERVVIGTRLGLSRPRHNQTFEGLALTDILKAKDAEPRCGLLIVDIDTGRTVEWLRFEHTIDELYDVAILEGVVQAEAVGFRGEEIETCVTPEA